MIRKLIKWLKNNFDLRTIILTFISIICYFLYALYNEIIGLINKTSWNLSIFVYYFLLLIVKIILIVGEIKLSQNSKKRRVIIFASYCLLFLITASMIGPAIILLKNNREYNYGKIIAITFAAYTTFSLIISLVNLKKTSLSNNLIVKQIRLINLISTLMSIIVLENTLILANGSYSYNMKLVSFYSSLIIMLIILILIIKSFISFIRCY